VSECVRGKEREYMKERRREFVLYVYKCIIESLRERNVRLCMCVCLTELYLSAYFYYFLGLSSHEMMLNKSLTWNFLMMSSFLISKYKISSK